MAQQTKNRLAKRNQHCNVTKENHKSQINTILLWRLLNDGISLHSFSATHNDFLPSTNQALMMRV